MWTKLLLPGIAGVTVTRVGMDDGLIWLEARTTGRFARCPICGRRSKWRHSQYWRTLVDEPCGSTPMRIRLALRRFRCRVPWCPRRIFAERVPSLAKPRVRHTARLQRRLTRVGLAVGGEVGVRLVRAQGISVSARTVLRLVRAGPLPDGGPVRILGVDDWSQRRGRTFRTILVNLETHTIVDLLPDRTAEVFAGWLRHHPEVTTISRDRAGAYADGARMGAPQARQIADRFHLVKNVTDALERYLTRKHTVLRQALLATGGTTQEPATSEAAQAPSVPATGELARARRARRLRRYHDVLDLHTQGYSGRAIARQTGLSRATVQQYLARESFPERRIRPPRPSVLAPYSPYLEQRWDDGCRNAAQLWRELRQQGFRGGQAVVRRTLQTWRPAGARGGKGAGVSSAAQPRYSPRQTCWLLLRDAATLSPDERLYVDHLYSNCPQIAVAQALVREFRTLLREQNVSGFYAWLKGVTLSAIPEFCSVARGIWRDRRAVEAAVTSPYSQGQTEGFVNKLKCTKRAGYGRANLDLLRRRLLYAG